MNATTVSASDLLVKKCVPCEGGVPRLSAEAVTNFLAGLPAWKLTESGDRIRRDWRAKDFMSAIAFFNKVAELAEAEGHHPDLHLEGYRAIHVEIWTHAIGGLSENDFILAAKIDEIPISIKA